jgi:hypothetical protein
MKKLVLATLFLMLGSAAALAADFSGKWTADVPGRGGQTMTNTFTFTIDGAKVTGKVSSQMGDTDISNAKIDGDTITFDVVREMNGNSFTLSYTGKMQADGTIKFTRAMGGGMGQGRPPQEFTATKAK